MINFKPFRDDFRYDTGLTGKVMEVSMSYQLGGANYFSLGNDPRGIYISFTVVTIGERSRSFTIGGGDTNIKCLLMELKRKSAKQLIMITEQLDREAPALAELAKTDVRAACRRAIELIEAWKRQAAAA